jgi:hypothetical protein
MIQAATVPLQLLSSVRMGAEPAPCIDAPGRPAVQEVVRVQLLREHADAVLEIRDRTRRAWEVVQ